MSAQQQPTDCLSEAAALLNNISASAETIRTLSNATTIEQQRNVGMPCVDTDSQLASPFPSRQCSSLPLPGAALVMRECAPRYHASADGHQAHGEKGNQQEFEIIFLSEFNLVPVLSCVSRVPAKACWDAKMSRFSPSTMKCPLLSAITQSTWSYYSPIIN